MEIIKNAWEFRDDEQAWLALTGHTSEEEYQADRKVRADELINRCGITQSMRGFEIGSGDGTVARLLAKHCETLDCVDISEAFLARARRLCSDRENVRFFKIQDNNLDILAPDSYDFGYSLGLFIHFNVYDICDYLHSVNRVLKQGGVFFFDASTLGPQTMALFREAALIYRSNPLSIRGLMNFNHPNVIRQIVEATGLQVDPHSQVSEEGWLKFLVRKV